MSGDPEQEYFADGMVDEILPALSRVRWLFVIARQSSFAYKPRSVDMRQIGRELGIRYVVEGSVRKAGNRVRITAQLIEAEAGAHLWAERYERDLSDIFALQDEITAQIVAAVETHVRAIEIRRARAKPPESLTAYDLYLRALWAYHGQTEVEYIRRRIQAHRGVVGRGHRVTPTTPRPWAPSPTASPLAPYMAGTRAGRAERTRPASLPVALSRQDPTTAHALRARRSPTPFCRTGSMRRSISQTGGRAASEFRFVRNRAAAVYIVCGESDQAIAQCETARRMNPLDDQECGHHHLHGPLVRTVPCAPLRESIQAGKRALVITPQINTARKYVAISLAQLGRIDEARAEIAELLKHQPDASRALFQLQRLRHDWMSELEMEGLRKAGLPEK